MSDLNSLKGFDHYQGRNVNATEADSIAIEQEEFCRRALEKGVEALRKFEAGDKLDEGVNLAFVHIREAFGQMLESDFSFEDVAMHLKELLDFVDGLEVSDSEKLFLEFLVGLLRFNLATRLSLRVSEEMLEDRSAVAVDVDSEAGFLEGMKVVEALAYEVICDLQRVYGKEDPFKFWSKLEGILNGDEELLNAAKILCSLQNVPKDKRLMSMAQVLHWNGVGGNGELLKDVPSLEFMVRQSISYFGDASGSNFSGRMDIFAKTVLILREAAMKDTAAYLETQFPDEDEFRVFDMGSGPRAGAVSALPRFLGDDKSVKITATDVSGSNLKSLCRLKEGGNTDVDGVMYQDMALEMSSAGVRNKFHVFSAGNVLHQAVDGEHGDDTLQKVMAFATDVVMPKGVILLQTVGESAYLQFPLIPGNLVDREGFMPQNVLDRVSFTDLAQISKKTGFVKIPYPLSALRKVSPEGLESGAGIYESNMFMVLEVLPQHVVALDRLRVAGDWKGANEIAMMYLNVQNIQDQVKLCSRNLR